MKSACIFNILPGFVVASEEVNSIGMHDFICDKKQESLEGVITSVDEITQEEIFGVGWG